MGKIESVLDPTKTITDTETYICENIIPRMMVRRGRTEALNKSEIVSKLFGIGREKPGEVIEFIDESQKGNFKLTPKLASEMADIIYYTSQKNCSDFIKDPSPFLTNMN